MTLAPERRRGADVANRILRAALSVLVVATLVAVQRSASTPPPAPAPAATAPEAADEDATLAAPLGASLVARLTGADSLNHTAQHWNVHGADLGHTFEHDGDLYMVFGDTWGADGVEGADWRSNTMARISDWDDPAQGLEFAEMIADPHGHAAELLSSRKRDHDEKTVIPTYGIAVDGRMYLHYMSVRTWERPGHWQVNHSGLATSDDGGHSWTKHADARWPGDSGFAQVALTPHAGMVYVLGVPEGRFGGASLARVAPDRLLELDRYEYWDGQRWVRGDHTAAEPIVEAPVGELSVRWSDYHQQWLMMYLDEHRAAIVLRTATDLTGPWSDEQVVVTAAQYPQLYAPYLLPSTGNGATVYFTMSVFDPYQVLLLSTTLDLPVLEARGVAEPDDTDAVADEATVVTDDRAGDDG